MKFTDLFIRRPVLATVVSLLILLLGVRSCSSLNVRQYPRSESSVVSVITIYTGASADLIQGFITSPLEREIASADGIDYIESNSSPSVSAITVHLRLNYDPNAALTQITSKINRVRNQLPAGSEDPIIDVASSESTASLYLSFYSEELNANQVTDYLYRVVQPKLSTVPGVQSAQILGARVFAMRIWLKPDQLTAYGLSPAQVWQALAANNYLAAIGATKGTMLSINLNAATDLKTADEFRRLVVKEQHGAIIRLGDVATVVLGAESYEAAVKFGDEPATFIAVSVLPTANTLTVIDAVRRILPQIESELPRGVSLRIPYDATGYIRDSIKEVVFTLAEALLIVTVVIYLFLGTFRSVIIPLVAMPLSLVGGCFLMLVLGFSINLLTLLAMVLAIGLVVDDAIVVVENIHRHIEEGRSPLQASLQGARELGGPVIAMTITLAAVYAPIGFQGGLTGALFREFAFTLAGSVIVSGVEALTLSPMMCSRLLRHEAGGRARFAHFLDTQFDRLRAGYQRLLHGTLDARPVVGVFAMIVFGSMFLFWRFSQNEPAPTEDQGFIISLSLAAPNANIDQLTRYAEETAGIIRSLPEAQNYFQVTGYPAANNIITGIVLKPWSERRRSAPAVLAEVTGRLGTVAGLNCQVFLPPSLPGAGGGTPVQFAVVSTDDPLRVAAVADELVRRAQQSGLFYYADSDLKFDQSQADVVVDRDRAADLGISMQQLGADLGTMLGGGYVNRFNVQGNSYKVIPQVDRVYRLHPSQLDNYYISTGRGGLVPLSSVASVRPKVQPQSLKRFQQLNAATISAVPRPGVSLGEALDFLNAQARQVFPASYAVDYGGQSRQFVKEASAFVPTLLFAVTIIFLVLAAQFESFRDPLIIMFSVPMAVSGALAFICLGTMGLSINIYTKVGLITLVGLVTKHGILITQFANQLQREGRSKRAAVEEAAGIRLRPILMTTAAMVFGVVPLIIASGAGAAARQHMGLIIATGMSIGTLFTLFVVPTAYTLLARDHHADREKLGLAPGGPGAEDLATPAP